MKQNSFDSVLWNAPFLFYLRQLLCLSCLSILRSYLFISRLTFSLAFLPYQIFSILSGSQQNPALPLYLEAIQVVLSKLSTAVRQENDFVNVVW